MRKDVNMQKAINAYLASDGMFRWYRAQKAIERNKRELRRLYIFTGVCALTELICAICALYLKH